MYKAGWKKATRTLDNPATSVEHGWRSKKSDFIFRKCLKVSQNAEKEQRK